ncbi:hypothetical protein V6N13_072613 [Hibiscus sabdariffa]
MERTKLNTDEARNRVDGFAACGGARRSWSVFYSGFRVVGVYLGLYRAWSFGLRRIVVEEVDSLIVLRLLTDAHEGGGGGDGGCPL